MDNINFWAVLVCSIVGFVVSTAWYSVFGKQMAKLHKAYAGSQQPAPWQIAVEFARSVTVAVVIAVLFNAIGTTDWLSGIGYVLLFWIGFPAVLLAGSVLWEKVPFKLAMFHAGDWLIKLFLFSFILSIWR
jgi:hypothetical protein